MPNWSPKAKIAAVVALFTVYFPIAFYLKRSYVPDQAPPGTVTELKRPFTRFRETGFDYFTALPELDALADSNDDPVRSPLMIYENDRPLGTPHNSSDDISVNGHGRFAHWRGIGFIFSSSDASSPDSNGRRYRVVMPPNPEPSPASLLPPPGMVAELERPFRKYRAGGFDYVVAAPALEDFADSDRDPKRSPFVVYENDRPLGPAHSDQLAIRDLGRGRFLHWKGMGFIISSSDETSPVTNRRKYWVVLPPAQRETKGR